MGTAEQFFQAVGGGEVAKVRELLEREPGLIHAKGDRGESAVLAALYRGRKDVAEFLIAKGAELSIFEASAMGKKAQVMELVNKDPSSVNSYSHDGFTPLALAAFFGHLEVVKLLLAHKADVNAISRNATGYTALTGAVARGVTEIAALLLAAGANANYRYGAGYSPLHEAAASGNLAMAKLLLDHGADAQAPMEDGRTPLALALEKEHSEVARLLRQYGATE